MDLSFHLKHWALTLIVGAALIIILLPLLHGQGLSGLKELDFGFLILLVSVPLSLPVTVLYFIAGYSLNLAPVNITVKKGILIILAVAGIFLTFKTIGGFLDNEFAFLYVAAAILTGIFLRLQ